jgi:hypothetical protein
MSRLPLLAPTAVFSDLFPPQTVLAPRTTTRRMRWVGVGEHQLNQITGQCMPVLGDMPIICHRNTLTPEIRAFYEMAGIQLSGSYLAYGSTEEAIGLAKECHAQDLRLAYYYPPPDEIAGDEYLAVPQSLYDWLNDKASIDKLCEARYLPRHRFFTPAEIAEIAGYLPAQAIYVKVCHPGPSGGGSDVRFCPDQASRQAALEWIAGRPPGWSAIRVEEALDIRESWCLNVSVGGAAGVRYLGAATQLFSSPAMQSGSRIDAESQPSAASVELALEIARRSHEFGFVGIAGFDIGETAEGEPCVFDLNFRIAACTAQVLLHESATRRIDGKISQSWNRTFPGPLAPALQRLEKFALSGQFVPLRLYDSSLAAEDSSRINGMLIGRTQAEIDELQDVVDAAVDSLILPQ